MEVHHHPHVEKKNFKEYLLEGLMIFLAVSMGFIAEGVRENMTKHEHEHHLMEILVQDLKEDSKKLDTAFQRNDRKVTKLDTLRKLLFTAIEKELPDSDYKRMYAIHFEHGQSALPLRFVPTDRALSQFEKNDAFNFIRKQNVSDSILNYKENNNVLISQFNVLRDYYQLRSNEAAHHVFKSSLIEGLRGKEGVFQSDKKFTLLTRDNVTLELYGFAIGDTRSFLGRYTLLLGQQKRRAERLCKLIQKEYHLENE